MKKYQEFFLMAISVFASTGFAKAQNDWMVNYSALQVMAPSGLSLRTEANLNAKRI